MMSSKVKYKRVHCTDKEERSSLDFEGVTLPSTSGVRFHTSCNEMKNIKSKNINSKNHTVEGVFADTPHS